MTFLRNTGFEQHHGWLEGNQQALCSLIMINTWGKGTQSWVLKTMTEMAFINYVKKGENIGN